MATAQMEERVRRLEGAYPALAMSVYVVEPENRAARRFAELRADIAKCETSAAQGFGELRAAIREYETRAAGRLIPETDAARLSADLRAEIAEYEILSIQQIIESRISIARLSTKSEIDMAREFGALRIQIAEGASYGIRWMRAIASFAVGAITVLDKLFSQAARAGAWARRALPRSSPIEGLQGQVCGRQDTG